eukprot:gene9392-1638_t
MVISTIVLVLIRSWLEPCRQSVTPLVVTELNVFPVKSCGGLSLKQASLDELGFEYDRRFMVISNEKNMFQTQRRFPSMAKVRMAFIGDDLVAVHDDGSLPPLYLCTAPTLRENVINTVEVLCRPEDVVGREFSNPPEQKEVTLWRDTINVDLVSPEHDAWFSKALDHDVCLVRTKALNNHHRPVSQNHGSFRSGSHVGFADGYPFLIASSASLYDVNSRSTHPVEMSRFRPNIVVFGCVPFEEDTWSKIQIANVLFDVVKACTRCTLPLVDPTTGKRDAYHEPNRTLKIYRSINGDTFFGQNAVHCDVSGNIQLYDRVTVLSTKDEPQAHLY